MAGLLGDSFDDPRSAMLMGLAQGLLGARGYGGATFGEALGAGGALGMQGYQQARQQQHAAARQKMLEAQFGMQNEEWQMKKAEHAAAQAQGAQMIAKLRELDPTGKLELLYRTDPKAITDRLFPKGMEVAKINPNDHTPESFAAALKANDPSLLRARTKAEFVNGVAVDPYAVRPGTVMPNPNQPFSLGNDGQPVPNQAYQKYELDKAAAGGTRVNVPVSVSTERSFLGKIADKAGEGIVATTEQAQASARTIDTVGRINAALDSGKVIAGPMTNPQILLRQVGQIAGFGGKNNDETLQRTRETMQGLASLELDAAQTMKGQGQITEAERALIKRAAGGDINMTLPELRALTGALEKVARSKIRANQQNIERLRGNPNAAPMVDFLNVPEPPQYRPPAGPRAAPSGLPPGWSVQEVR